MQSTTISFESFDNSNQVTGDIETPNEFVDTSQDFADNKLSSLMWKLPAKLNLSSEWAGMPTAMEWMHNRKQNLKPWLVFLSTSKFGVPSNPQVWTKRVVKNLDYFLSNYMFVFIGLFIYCLITSPLLLIVVAACMGCCYILSLKNAERKFQISGKEFTLVQQYMAVAILSFPLFYLAGATTALFWVIGASFFVIMIHASAYNIESLPNPEEEPFSVEVQQV